MSNFSGYEKMPSSIKKLGLSEADFSKLEKYKWVVTEKVHGANFSFIYEENNLKFAKRKDYLSWNDDFFGFQLVVSQIEDQILSLFEELNTTIKANKFIVYGELFGGKYPHDDVPPAPNVHAIQTGVYYAPNIQFCAFDIAIETNESNEKYYLDYQTAVGLFDKHGVFYAKPLLIGKFSEATGFNTRINSTVPALLGLPEITDNLIEGVVVKPFDLKEQEVTFSRPIVKIKNKEFEEENKFHEAEKWTYIPNVSSKSEDLSFILDELRNYITKNRLESAISKTGALDFSNANRVKEIELELFHDTLIDFNENNPNVLSELSESENSWINDRVKAEISKLMHQK